MKRICERNCLRTRKKSCEKSSEKSCEKICRRTPEKFDTRKIAGTGILAAAVYAASAFLQIPIPTLIGSTRLHMGNVMCLLSGMVLGPVFGGLAAGTGSMLFDLTNPAYVTSAPFTFAFKFVMAFICGKGIRWQRLPLRARYLLGASTGALAYVVLYLAKNFVEHRFVVGLPLEAVAVTIAQKGAVAVVNGVTAVAVAVPLGLALRRAARNFL